MQRRLRQSGFSRYRLGRLFIRVRNLLIRAKGDPLLPPGIRLGANVAIHSSEFDYDWGRHITIDDDAIVSSGVRILCHDAARYRQTGILHVAPVHIGRRVFMGAGSLVMPGVTIGDDAVVAAGAVVAHDVANGAIVAGVPAKQIGTVQELDAKRRRQVTEQLPFNISVYNNRPTPPNLLEEMQEAAEEHGGYFLVAPRVAAALLEGTGEWPAPW